MDSRYNCSICGSIQGTFGRLIRHLTLFHEPLPNFTIDCLFCSTSFRTVCALTKHVQRHHKILLNDLQAPEHHEEVAEESNLPGANEDNFNDDYSENIEEDISSDSLPDLINFLEKRLALFILQLKEVHMLSQKVQKIVVNFIKSFLITAFGKYVHIIRNLLSFSHVDINDDAWKDILDVETLFECLGRISTTERSLWNYLKRCDMIIQPRELHAEITDKADDSTVTVPYIYVPINQVLTKFLSHSDVLENLNNFSQSFDCNGTLLTYGDGDIRCNDPFWLNNPISLPLQLYVDEVELCNPIGSKRGKHKLTAFYYMLGNIPQQFRSQLRFINLALLIKHQYVKKANYDYSVFLDPLLQDLITLQSDGINISRGASVFNIKGKVISISADNLSAHALAGLQQYFNSGRICRFCMVDHGDIGKCLTESDVIMRNSANHTYHLEAVIASESNKNMYGVQRSCAFSILPNFDLFKLFPPDIMHDFMEGVIPVTVQLILHNLVSQGYTTVYNFNESLRNLKLVRKENRPCPITDAAVKDGGHIIGTAIQKFELFLILPFLVGSSVPKLCKSWQVYLCLRDVCDLVFAPSVDKDNLFLLEELVAKYLCCFIEVFGSNKIIPKMHYMIHYPSLIRLFGPLRNFWCMRFESKHQYFKKLAARTKSFRNITLSLAKRHQLHQSWELSAECMFDLNDGTLSKTNVMKFSKLDQSVRDSVKETLDEIIADNETVFFVKCLSLNSVLYKIKGIYVIDTVTSENVPVFYIIGKILKIRDTWVLCGHFLVPDLFDEHLHAYEVHKEKSWLVCRPGNFVDYTQHDYYKVHNKKYVSVRYEVTR